MLMKRCLFCREWFEPYPAQATRQQICGRLHCKRKFKRTLDRAWRQREPGWRKDLEAKKRVWAAKRKYWSWYRSGHPAYVARDNRRRVRARRRYVRKTGTMN
jgi:hypothetical protein